MEGLEISRRGVFKTLFAAAIGARMTGPATAAELSLPMDLPEEKFTFDDKGIEGWTTVSGQWAVDEMAGAATGKRVLVQRATTNDFNVIVAPPGPFSDIEVTVKFYPMSGRQDASGGIVFRLHDGRYYVVRANALEDNFRLYAYDRGRRQLASATVKRPPFAHWHLIRVVAIGDRLQASLNGVQLLDHRDSRFKAGRVGLWTKADSITAFDALSIRGVKGAGS
jgi:Domain of Unknown Function (DUF1080)